MCTSDEQTKINSYNYNLSYHLLESWDEIDYDQILRDFCHLTGAKYGVFNLYSMDSATFTNTAVYGVHEMIDKAYSLLGYQLNGKRWNVKESRLNEIKGGEPVRFESLYDLAKGVLSRYVCTLISKSLQIGPVYVLEIASRGRTIGDFIVMFRPGKELKYPTEATTYANILGMALYRRRANDSIRQEQKRYKETSRFLTHILESIQDAISIHKPDLTIQKANSVMRNWFRDENTLEGKKCYDICDNRGIICDDCPLLKSLRTGESHRMVVQGKYGEGDHFFEIFSHPMKDSESEEVTGIVKVVRDITDQFRIESELRDKEQKHRAQSNRLSALIKNLPGGILIENINRRIHDTNARFCELFGIDALPETLIGADCREAAESVKSMFIEEAEFVERIDSLIKANRPHLNEELRLKDGRVFRRDFVPVDMGSADGTEILWYYSDITSQKKILEDLQHSNSQLAEAKKRAEESDQLKSAFLANMSHEIRTPMNAIIGFASFLQDDDISMESIKNYASIISNSGNHLLNLINDIIDISKIDSGQATTNPRPVNLTDLLKELYHLFLSQLYDYDKDHIRFTMDTPETDRWIITDETRLKQILINLIGNATKFTSEGYVRVTHEISGDKVKFSVEDSGIGISPRQKNQIFERFRQASSTTEKHYGGTGLGLPIAKACAELLGGSIWLESQPEKGTTFHFTIDYKPYVAARDEVPGSDSLPDEFNGEHILVAEDDDLSHQYLEKILKKSNLKISRTITGTDTLESVLGDRSISLVLMDIQLPGINGWNVTRELRKKGISIPIIAQTAYAFESDRQSSLEAGCDDYISKPIKKKELNRILHRHLNK